MKFWDRLTSWQQIGAIFLGIGLGGWAVGAEYNLVKRGIADNTKDIKVAASSIKTIYGEIIFIQNKRRLEQLQDRFGKPHCPNADKAVQRVCEDLERAMFQWLSRKVKK